MPITIADVLLAIQEQSYVLPAIQREFVWDPDEQVVRLFDSLLRGYPIGSFLSWAVDAEHVKKFKLYGFIKDFHELNAPYCPVLDIPTGKSVTAILDGQQRLTALNIGLRGSHAKRARYRPVGKSASYPTRHLYLNILGPAPENELGMVYDFRFFEHVPESRPGDDVHWFPVREVFTTEDPIDFQEHLIDHELGSAKGALKLLSRLHKTIHVDPTVYFFEEREQDIDRVLDIFIRVNSAGTVLSHSDLLLSIATAQWDELDAREEIHTLVSELNGDLFDFSKDVVLKSGLVLTGVGEIGFKVTNFNHDNMARLEKGWEAIADALKLAVGLFRDFGLSASTLSADSVLIPLAYYVHRRGLSDSYRTAGKYDHDRSELRHWVFRTLVKPGVWGSGLDTLLGDLRTVIDEHGADAFPVAELGGRMAARGKSLAFLPEELHELIDTPYKSRLAFPLLALLFPNVDTRNVFHLDHVFPQWFFHRKRLTDAGVDGGEVDSFKRLSNGLPNLQLLEGPVNIEKQRKLPLEWAINKYGDGFGDYLARQCIDEIPASVKGFRAFYEQRHRDLLLRLEETLGTLPTGA